MFPAIKKPNAQAYAFLIAMLTVAMIAFSSSMAAAETQAKKDKHAGYYYPAHQSEETYQAPLPPLQGVSRRSRVGFVTQLDKLQKKRPYPPEYHMFAKGGDAEKLIIVATSSGRYDTLFRLRGLLASMTADARLSPLFAKLGHVEQLNFFDLLRMAGFKQLTISNGDDVAHRVYLD